MSNSGDAGNKGSPASNTNPQRAEESPRRRVGGDNSPALTPRGRGSSPRRPPSTPVSGSSASRPPTTPGSGTSGTPASKPPTTPGSGSTPASRPPTTPGSGSTPASRPPTTPGSGSTPSAARTSSLPHWMSSPGAIGSASGSGGQGLVGALSVPVGGSGGGAAAVAPLGVGGSLIGRKRAREGDVGGGRGGEGGADHPCSVCGKSYASLKALFGHMRKHPDRGWKGVHPPPTFKAEEEFADIRAEVAGAIQAAAPPDQGEAVAPPAEDDTGEPRSYRVPDLNHPPPPDKA